MPSTARDMPWSCQRSCRRPGALPSINLLAALNMEFWRTKLENLLPSALIFAAIKERTGII